MQWQTSPQPVSYVDAVAVMEQRVAEIIAGKAPELIWLLEHPPLYTAGTSAKAEDLLHPQFTVYTTGRGGQYTYHGPGQRVVYVMLNLQQRMQGKPDLRKFVWLLEEWIIRTLAAFDVVGERRDGRVGIWVGEATTQNKDSQPSKARRAAGGSEALGACPQENKIAALGIRVRKWVTFHGIAINLNPNLSHFGGIVPCGIREYGVTSLGALGKLVTMEMLDTELQRQFALLDF